MTPCNIRKYAPKPSSFSPSLKLLLSILWWRSHRRFLQIFSISFFSFCLIKAVNGLWPTSYLTYGFVFWWCLCLIDFLISYSSNSSDSDAFVLSISTICFDINQGYVHQLSGIESCYSNLKFGRSLVELFCFHFEMLSSFVTMQRPCFFEIRFILQFKMHFSLISSSVSDLCTTDMQIDIDFHIHFVLCFLYLCLLRGKILIPFKQLKNSWTWHRPLKA